MNEREKISPKKEKNILSILSSPLRPLTEKVKGALPWIAAGAAGTAYSEVIAFFSESAISHFFPEAMDDPTRMAIYGAFGLFGFFAGLAALEESKIYESMKITRKKMDESLDYYQKRYT